MTASDVPGPVGPATEQRNGYGETPAEYWKRRFEEECARGDQHANHAIVQWVEAREARADRDRLSAALRAAEGHGEGVRRKAERLSDTRNAVAIALGLPDYCSRSALLASIEALWVSQRNNETEILRLRAELARLSWLCDVATMDDSGDADEDAMVAVAEIRGALAPVPVSDQPEPPSPTAEEWRATYTEMFDESQDVDTAIGLAIGAASMCWENVAGAGVFDSSRAAVLAEVLHEHVQLNRSHGGVPDLGAALDALRPDVGIRTEFDDAAAPVPVSDPDRPAELGEMSDKRKPADTRSESNRHPDTQPAPDTQPCEFCGELPTDRYWCCHEAMYASGQPAPSSAPGEPAPEREGGGPGGHCRHCGLELVSHWLGHWRDVSGYLSCASYGHKYHEPARPLPDVPVPPDQTEEKETDDGQ